jgi:Tol biopolymer transport system component
MNLPETLLSLLAISLIALTMGNADPLSAKAPTIFAPGVISGPAHDSAPAFTPDGQTVYFSRSSAAGCTILVSHLRNGRWSHPEIAAFSGEWSDLEPAMSPDGSFLIFVSNRPANSTGKPVDGFYNGKAYQGHGGNLWRVDRVGDGWGKPARLPDSVNRSGSVFAPSVVRDGSVYFMEAMGEKGRFQLFRSQFLNGAWQPAQTVSFSDGASTNVDPAVAPDESFAVFGSGRAPAQSMDLFIVFRKDGAWGQPIHMGTEVNSPTSDAEARLSPDGKTLYFSSERVVPITYPRTLASARQDLKRLEDWDNGNYNIWAVSLSPWLSDHQ